MNNGTMLLISFVSGAVLVLIIMSDRAQRLFFSGIGQLVMFAVAMHAQTEPPEVTQARLDRRFRIGVNLLLRGMEKHYTEPPYIDDELDIDDPADIERAFNFYRAVRRLAGEWLDSLPPSE